MTRNLFAIIAFASIVAAGALAGCYKTPDRECAFACEFGGSELCPDGYTCRADNLCKRDDVADSFACPDISVDASPTVDAPTDAADPDAAQIDAAQIDAAAIDAAVDAPTDAPIVIDAPVIDAPTIDALMIDALLPDAPVDAPTDAEPDAV